MTEELSSEEVAILIKARQIQKARGLVKDANVKSICEMAGISRKTGYQWAKGLKVSEGEEKALEEEIARLKEEREELKKHNIRLEAINEGQRLSWEIHGVDELLAAKKNTAGKRKKKKR